MEKTMKTVGDLKKFFNTYLRKKLLKLEEERKALAGKVKLSCASAGATGLILSVVLGFVSGSPGPFVIGTVLTLILCTFLFKHLCKNYRSRFKDEVIHELVKFIDERLDYKKSSCISEKAYKQSGLFRKRYHEYKGDDLVQGVLDKTKIIFSELHTLYETRDSKGNRHRHTIFRGLFFIGDFNKAFSGKTYVLPDSTERLFGRFGKMLQSLDMTRGELVKLEDPEFEKEFKVYSTDQIEARYILSTSLMSSITGFKRRNNKRIHMAFADSSVYVAISYSKALFEPKIFTSLLDFEPIKEYFEDLRLCIGIVEDLNLNTRIWSKA